jgi:hypothetical protein
MPKAALTVIYAWIIRKLLSLFHYAENHTMMLSILNFNPSRFFEQMHRKYRDKTTKPLPETAKKLFQM